MGIKNLMKFLKEKASSSIKPVNTSRLTGKYIAVDASLAIYQFLANVRSMGQVLTDADGNVTSHLQGLLSRTVRLVSEGIIPVYVFDGKPPELKSDEIEKRIERKKKAEEELSKAIEEGNTDNIDKFSRRTIRLEKEQVDECKKLLELMGIPFIEAPCEAEAQCAALCKKGICYAVSTEDMDTLAFGSPRLIRYLTGSFSKNKEPIEITFKNVIEEIGFTYEEFVDLCILFGCDYTSTIDKVGYKTAYNLMSECKSIEKIIEKYGSHYNVPENFNYKGARQLFFEHEVITDYKPRLKDPNEAELKKFLVDEKNFSAAKIDKIINDLRKLKKERQTTMDSFFQKAQKPKLSDKNDKSKDDKEAKSKNKKK